MSRPNRSEHAGGLGGGRRPAVGAGRRLRQRHERPLEQPDATISNQTSTYSSLGTRPDLRPGRFMYDLAHWRSEFRVIWPGSVHRSTRAPFSGAGRCRDRRLRPAACPPAAQVARDRPDLAVPPASATSTLGNPAYSRRSRIEYLSLPNTILEDRLPRAPAPHARSRCSTRSWSPPAALLPPPGAEPGGGPHRQPRHDLLPRPRLRPGGVQRVRLLDLVARRLRAPGGRGAAGHLASPAGRGRRPTTAPWTPARRPARPGTTEGPTREARRRPGRAASRAAEPDVPALGRDGLEAHPAGRRPDYSRTM